MTAGIDPSAGKAPRDPLSGGAVMAAAMRAHDWSHSTLGPPGAWPRALREVVRLMLNAGHPVYIWWGGDGACLYNDAYLLSIGPEGHPGDLGRPAREVWGEVWDTMGPQIDSVMAGGGPSWHENALVPITRDGVWHDLYWTYSCSPIDDETAPNGVGGVMLILAETTAQVLAARKLTIERDQLSRMFEEAPTFMALMSGPEHRFEQANPDFLKLIDRGDVVGRTVAEALPDAVEQGYLEVLDQVFDSGEPYAAEGAPYAAQATPGGPAKQRFVDFVFQPVKDADGRVTGIFTLGADATARAIAQSRRDALVRLTDIVRDADDPSDVAYAAAEILGRELGVSRAGYGAIDAERDTLSVERDWNAPGVESLAGVVPLREYGSFIDSLKRGEFIAIGDVELDTRTAGAAEALKGRRARAFVNVPVLEQGRLVAVLYINDDKVRAWTPDDLAFIREMAERTRTAVERIRGQAALLESQARLRRANETLEASVAERTRELEAAHEALRQSQKMEAVGQLTGGIAHDFNNLLAGISGSLELIERRLGEGRLSGIDRYIDAAQTSARRAAALTQRLLAFSRRQTLDPKPVDANRLIAGMEELVRRSVGPNVEVEVVGAGGLWLTRIDPSQLENALLNLCINGRDAMAPSGGRLTIETANKWLDERAARNRDLPPGQYISLCVTDTGTGMTPEVIERAFDPFFTTKPLGEGTGLGLSMIYGFVRQSGGQVRIYSELGKGTTMCLYLPRHAGPDEPADEETPPSPGEAGAGETVLVIDDEATIRMLIGEVLKESGYAAIEASDGPSGLKVLQSDARVDLLITDVGLPGGLNGRQVADAARAFRPGLKVLFITGYAENAAVGNGLLDIGMDVLTKPFVMADLAVKIRDLLER